MLFVVCLFNVLVFEDAGFDGHTFLLRPNIQDCIGSTAYTMNLQKRWGLTLIWVAKKEVMEEFGRECDQNALYIILKELIK